MIYLLAFLYAHQHEKVIVFVSNCELANHLVQVVESLDFNNVGRRKEEEGTAQKATDASEADQS
jgi:hypothetical protein